MVDAEVSQPKIFASHAVLPPKMASSQHFRCAPPTSFVLFQRPFDVEFLLFQAITFISSSFRHAFPPEYIEISRGLLTFIERFTEPASRHAFISPRLAPRRQPPNMPMPPFSADYAASAFAAEAFTRQMTPPLLLVFSDCAVSSFRFDTL